MAEAEKGQGRHLLLSIPCFLVGGWACVMVAFSSYGAKVSPQGTGFRLASCCFLQLLPCITTSALGSRESFVTTEVLLSWGPG